MTLWTVECDSHDLGWVLASECSHWPHKCLRAKKAKKNNHKFVRSEPGYLVMVNGISSSDLLREELVYGRLDYDALFANDPGILELSEKRVMGKWVHGRGDERQPFGSYFVSASKGEIVTCTQCGLKGTIRD